MATTDDFWCQVKLFTAKIREEFEVFDQSPSEIQDKEQIERKVIEKCEYIVENVVKSIVCGETPVLRIPKPPRKDGRQANGDTLVSLGSEKEARRFAIVMHTLAQAYSHVTKGTYATRRDVFYENVALYRNQSSVDRTVEDLARMCMVPRHGLHLTITSKGLVAGCLTYTTNDGLTVNVQEANQGTMIPDGVGTISEVSSEARYILVVEKDATFQKLVEGQVHRSYGPAILITGKGYPDLPTRQFLYRLWTSLKIPVFALTDADPYGLHIAAVYKFGSIARDEPGLCVSNLAWLGILPSDLAALQLPKKALLPLTPADCGKLASLAAHPDISSSEKWLRQIELQRQLGKKAEIQGLTHIQQDFLTTVYLPRKLRQGGWID
ncbi:meiotic recombination protein SPO11-like isoform X1 [Macrobrachium nipponense]|uniref:meiotic recombination protein SPO11-like isoform X1 n=1 Tax=Macrobrachium nipponense TaxID=159736 RepID=UPI0030C7FD3D